MGALELFVRFAASKQLGGRGVVTVTLLRPDGSDRRRVFRKRFRLPAATGLGLLVYDIGLKLVNLSLPAEGTYAVRVCRPTRRRWHIKRTWRVLAADHFTVERA